MADPMRLAISFLNGNISEVVLAVRANGLLAIRVSLELYGLKGIEPVYRLRDAVEARQ